MCMTLFKSQSPTWGDEFKDSTTELGNISQRDDVTHPPLPATNEQTFPSSVCYLNVQGKVIQTRSQSGFKHVFCKNTCWSSQFPSLDQEYYLW